ncbi:MAG: hypothetical protein AAF849_17245 [Bacteroidota bacterium]
MKYFCCILFLSFSLNTSSAQVLLTSSAPNTIERPIVKLKNILLKNLLADEQITSTSERVELEFKHDQVLINQTALDYRLQEKYTYILKGLGFTVAERYVISLQRDYISLRAYTEAGTIQRLMIDAGTSEMQL